MHGERLRKSAGIEVACCHSDSVWGCRQFPSCAKIIAPQTRLLWAIAVGWPYHPNAQLLHLRVFRACLFR